MLNSFVTFRLFLMIALSTNCYSSRLTILKSDFDIPDFSTASVFKTRKILPNNHQISKRIKS